MREIKELLACYVKAIEKGVVGRARTTWCKGLDHLSDPVRKAFLTVERHRLLEGFYRWAEGTGYTWVPLDPSSPNDEALAQVYTAAASGLVIKLSPQGTPTSSSSSPLLMAIMLEHLDLKPGMRVLEIGTGTGYNAALMAEIVGKQELVTTLELQPDLAERAKRLLRSAGYGGIQVHCADGFYGWPKNAPYDRIVATTCCADISPHWLEQVTPGGWMLVPLRHGGETMAPLTQVYPDGRGRVLDPAGFGPAQGMLSDSGPWAQVPEPKSWLPDHSLPGKKLLRLPDPIPSEFNGFTAHFHYFVALNEPNACLFMWSGQDVLLCVLLWDNQTREYAGLACGEDRWVRVIGGERLCKCLEGIYREYEEFGQPRVSDYQMEFLLRSAPLEPTGPMSRVRRLGSQEWVIERRFTIQRVWLPG